MSASSPLVIFFFSSFVPLAFFALRKRFMSCSKQEATTCQDTVASSDVLAAVSERFGWAMACEQRTSMKGFFFSCDNDLVNAENGLLLAHRGRHVSVRWLGQEKRPTCSHNANWRMGWCWISGAARTQNAPSSLTMTWSLAWSLRSVSVLLRTAVRARGRRKCAWPNEVPVVDAVPVRLFCDTMVQVY